MKTGSPKKTYSRRMIVLAALVMATGLGLSAPMAEAKKRHHHRHPAFNVVQCPTEGSIRCVGTDGNDHLIGRAAGFADLITGKEGNDVYEGNGGHDELTDVSTTSSDTYVFKGPDLGLNRVEDCGGSSDTVDLSSTSFRLLDNVTITRQNALDDCPGASADDLTLSDPAGGTVEIIDQYGVGKVEKIKFANGTLTF